MLALDCGQPYSNASCSKNPFFRGWSHITAFFAAIALCPILISSSAHRRVLAAFYSLSVVALGVSSLYHGFSWNARAHDLLRRLDHATIFVTIAATYTPISWCLLPRSAVPTVLLAVWIGALLGVLVMIFGQLLLKLLSSPFS